MKNDFVSNEMRQYKFQLGRTIASSLAGFLAGIITTLIIVLSLYELSFKSK